MEEKKYTIRSDLGYTISDKLSNQMLFLHTKCSCLGVYVLTNRGTNWLKFLWWTIEASINLFFFLLWFHELLVLLFNYSQFRPPEVEIQIPKLKKISKKNYSLFFIFKPVWSLYKPMSSQSDISYSKVLFHKLLSCCIKNQQHRPKAVVFNLFSPCTLHVGAAYFSKVLKTK